MSFIENFAENLAEELGDALATTADAVGGVARNAARIGGGAAADAATVAADKAIAIADVVSDGVGGVAGAVGFSHTTGAEPAREFISQPDGLRAKPVETDKAERMADRLDRDEPSAKRASSDLASDDDLSLQLPDVDVSAAKSAPIDDLALDVLALEDPAPEALDEVLGVERPAMAVERSKVDLDRAIDEVALDLGEAATLEPTDDVFADVLVSDAAEVFEIALADDAEPSSDFAEQLEASDDIADSADDLWDDIGE